MSFWESATSAIQTFSSTLDKLDRTVGDPGSGDEAPDESDEMAACRVMLERAQMDIVQISQQSRVLLAEKEASINMWRQKYLESTGNIEPADMSSLIDMEALLTERNALLSNLSSLEDKLKEAHAQQSGPLIKAQMYDNLVTKHAKLAEEYASMVSDVESKSRGESDTIEHLVSEYTNLGAEFERRQATDAARIHEVERENEVLTMKLLAMEHSITEFADRASTSTASPSAASSGEYAVLQNDAKELRAKLVNLQFDLKEKEDEIGRLKTVIDDAGSAVVLSSALSEKDFNELRAEFEAIRADYFKAVAERDEAEAVGKAALSESEKMQHEIKRLNEILEASDKCDNEMSRLREEVSVLVNDLDDKVAQCSSYEEEVKNLKASKSVMLHEMDKTKADFADSIACIEQTKCLLEQAVSKHNIEFSEVESKLSSADETITGLRCRIEEIEAAHKAEISNTSVSDTEILQRIERAVLLERNKHVAEMENALNNLRVELEDSCVLMIQQKHDELTASSSRNLKDLKISSDVEKNEAILKITTEFDARLENCLADQRQELNSIHSDAIAQKIEELQTQFQRTMGEKIDEVKLSLAEEYSLSMRLQKEDDNRLLQEACEKVREELTRNLAGDSEEKVAAMTAEFSSRLDAAILKERVESEHLLVTAVQKQRNEDEELKIKAVEDAVATMKRNMENAEREKLQALRDELQFELASTVKGLQQAAAADLLVSLQKQVDEDKADCQRAIDNLRIELENIHATVLAKALADSELEHAAAIDGEKAIAEANLSSAVQKQQAEDEKIKESALTSLKAVHVAELESTLSKAGQELRAAVALEKENGRLAIEKCATEWAARVDEKEQALLVLKEELKSMQHDFDRKLQIEIDVISRQKDIEKAREIAEIRTETDATVAKAKAEREEYLTLYTKEYKQRKLIHNKLLEIQGNIRVMCRVRPVLEVERRMAADVDVTEIPNEDTIIIHRDVATKNRYEFDQVFSPSSTQEQVFEAVQPLVISVLDGYNVCIFAYGQTGSGKTFTMEGSSDMLGVSPRAINELFRVIESVAEDWVYTVTFSSLEIYNETIRDLLDATADREKLDVRQTPQGNSVPGLTEVQVTSAAQVTSLMNQGQSNRAVGSHDMNEHSSRSHSILTLVCQGKSLRDGNTTYGKLHLIDLAGSERIGKTDASGDRLKEAQNINRSLSALGDVINALGNKKNSHIPYRNSKLTFLLQDSLGGNSKVMMFVNTSPAIYNLGETVCSLNFAARCRNVELGCAKKQNETAVAESSGPLPIKSLIKRSSSNTAAVVNASDPANRRSTFGTPSARK